jgi:hypothetical protein
MRKALVPVLGGVALEDRELRRAKAKASLRNNWRLAAATGADLSDEQIDSEIDQVGTVSPRTNIRLD